MEEVVLSVSDFVAVFNQTLEYAYPNITIVGELSNFKISKNKWIFFDLKDDFSSVRFFGTVYNLPGPLEDGLMLQVKGTPRLHPQFGFSVGVSSIKPVGEGSLQKAAALLSAKLAREGLFEAERKRSLPVAPKRIGLIASRESAGYHDFIKIINNRWAGIEICLADVQVQGEAATTQIVKAVEYFNQQATEIEVLVITRGGGSADDLSVFNTEQVTRAVAGSRTPTLVAIGHEVDISLAEMASDQRASTPSNAAELLVPDKRQVTRELANHKQTLMSLLGEWVKNARSKLSQGGLSLNESINNSLKAALQDLNNKKHLLNVLSPRTVLERGYAIIKGSKGIVRSFKQVKAGDKLNIIVKDGQFKAEASE